MFEEEYGRLLLLRHTRNGERVRLAARAYDEEVVSNIKGISAKYISTIHNAVLHIYLLGLGLVIFPQPFDRSDGFLDSAELKSAYGRRPVWKSSSELGEKASRRWRGAP